MASSHGWQLQTAKILWILLIFFRKSMCISTQTYYMSGGDCGQRIVLGAALVYSHVNTSKYYADRINCQLRFKARNKDWKLMLRVLEMDIPDRDNNVCNDALYVFDSDNMFTTPMREAGGNKGLCGNKLPSTLYSSGPNLTVHFITNDYTKPSRFSNAGHNGRGFKFIVTSYSDEFEKSQSCGPAFKCDNNKCIESGLACDRLDNCGDYSDESPQGPGQCGVPPPPSEENFLTKFLSLGVAASVGIIVGGLVVCIFCTAALVCCCRNSVCRKRSPSSTDRAAGTQPLTNGGPPSHHGGGSHHGSVHGSQHGSHHGNTHYHGGGVVHQPMSSPFTSPTQQGYYPMHPVYPSPHGSVYSAHTQNSAFTRDSGFTHNQYGYSSSVYSSQAPSYHRSHTPTSSKSGKSHHSNNSVTYAHNSDKVMLPVNL